MKYSELTQIYEKLEGTSKRLEKTHIVSELFRKTKADEIDKIVLLIQGRLFPLWDETTLGVSERLVIKAINTAAGISPERIEHEWKKIGDLGLVAEKLIAKKSQVTLFSRELSIEKVYNNIKSLANAEGHGSVDQKVKIIAELLSSAKPLEARYVIRTILEDMRVGVGAGSIRDALVWAFFAKEAKVNYDENTGSITPDDREEYNRIVALVQHAFDLKADYAEVAKIIMTKGEKGLSEVSLEPGNPVSAMLYPKAKSLPDAFERVGRPCAFEYKYDGFRMQIHKKGKKIQVFTRRLDEVTAQFPEVIGFVEQCVQGDYFILDSEAVGYDPITKRYLPFQAMSQRIRRKHDIERTAKELPVEVNVFDVILYNGKNMLNEPFIERRKLLEKIIKPKEKNLVLAKQLITDDLKKAEGFYREALKVGEEGVMAKSLQGIYQPGARVGIGVKVKPIMESLDLVIVGAEWGTGKRSGWLTSFVLACKDGDSFLEIGKVGTGLKEQNKRSLPIPETEQEITELEEEGASFEELTNLVRPHIMLEEGKTVKVRPKVIIEVNYEEIQKSPTYGSGYALRFPRFVRIRYDKGLADVSDIGLVKQFFREQ